MDVIGIDNLSFAAVATTATSFLITDNAGHTLEALFTKSKQKARRINVVFSAFLYDGAPFVPFATTTLKYKWNTNPNGTYKMFASFLASATSSVEAHYRPKKNITIFTLPPTDLDDSDNDDASDSRPIKEKLPGMVVPYMMTNQGRVVIGY